MTTIHAAIIIASDSRVKLDTARGEIVKFLYRDNRVTPIIEGNKREDYLGATPDPVFSFMVGPDGIDSTGAIPTITRDTIKRIATLLGVSCVSVSFTLE